MSETPAGLPSPAIYVATQDVIVPKEPFFAHIVAEMTAHARELAPDGCLAVAEPGCGPGFFFPYLIQHFTRDETTVSSAFLCGIDRHPQMLKLTEKSAEREARRQGARHRWIIGTRLEAEATDPAAAWWKNDAEALGEVPWSVILASQFEQYAANSETSPLAQRLAQTNRPVVTKNAFRQQANRALSEGGLYAVITDVAASTEAEAEAWNRAWDSHVAKRFASLDFLRSIAEHDLEQADFLARHYNPRLGWDKLIALAARARRHRRWLAYEEVETVQQLHEGLASVFGEKNVSLIHHPSTETHPQFVLALAWKRA